ncbi:MAG: hypothetical protein CM15mP126_2490 [Gammaproteobacteria bacterium]|nr:MAG: hypothetical protein CM15mP126_2490 [Gammaproteobacteria bacterium]
MRVNKGFFRSFLYHFHSWNDYLIFLGFFFFESQERSVLSKPVNVNLVFEEKVNKNNSNPIIQKTQTQEIKSSEPIIQNNTSEKSISFDSLIES